jgi:deoxyadenosine/deoxycytidine kinase
MSAAASVSAAAATSESPILITLDGNIGAGKSTLLEVLRERIPWISVIPEPVGEWLQMKNAAGESLLELFYKDTERWAYTFQNCAILTRLIDTLRILKEWKPVAGKLPIIVTERSVLTDRHVFADMLHSQGKLDDLEWNLYLRWYDAFAKELPIRGILHLSTSASTSKERIAVRGRSGEGDIPMNYLEALDAQHKKWVAESTLPTLSITTEPGTNMEEVAGQVEAWLLETFVKCKED